MIPEVIIIVIKEFRMCKVQIKRIAHADAWNQNHEDQSGMFLHEEIQAMEQIPELLSREEQEIVHCKECHDQISCRGLMREHHACIYDQRNDIERHLQEDILPFSEKQKRRKNRKHRKRDKQIRAGTGNAGKADDRKNLRCIRIREFSGDPPVDGNHQERDEQRSPGVSIPCIHHPPVVEIQIEHSEEQKRALLPDILRLQKSGDVDQQGGADQLIQQSHSPYRSFQGFHLPQLQRPSDQIQTVYENADQWIICLIKIERIPFCSAHAGVRIEQIDMRISDIL